jgi:putative selenate reductase
MSAAMKVQPFAVLLHWILQELAEKQSIFGIHRSLFYTPQKDSPYATPDMFGHYLATPIGPAAGPHTQLAQNILCAWLSGGRFIELKTVQIMDELEITRPCIDMADEGYNVEWSQELKLEQSAGEYIKAWALIHILPRLLGFAGEFPLGTIFNLSVGYNLEGIKRPPMTRFMDRLIDASEEIAPIRAILKKQFPQFADIAIPPRLTNNVTLSTMHGCPPDEIERIARYLLQEKGLHTTVKLNPTLLGKEKVLGILHDDLGFSEIQIPDAVFEHDLQYGRAVELIQALQRTAAEQNLTFGVKLSNTLAMANHKGVLPGHEMYMSGRALYPITINLFHKLAKEFQGDPSLRSGQAPSSGSGQGLNVSYSAGADALNVTTILASGARPVTVASDLLQPGGYSRLRQYLENLETEMRQRGAASLEELARHKLANLAQAAADALKDPRYKKSYHPYGLPKVASGLARFDCITAPCVAQCAVCQDVPEYACLIAQGEYERALEVILARNPLPGVTGYVCTHLCQTRCTRNNYDEPVAIRALKRFAAEQGAREQRPALSEGEGSRGAEACPERRRREQGGTSAPRPLRTSAQVAVIGSGPSGLAAAYFLALNGVQVTIFEAKDRPGGMLALAPAFRLPPAIVQEDVERITGLGVKIELSHPITTPPEQLLEEGFEAVYVACGFPKDARLDIPGIEGQGVCTALDLLERVARGEKPALGSKTLVIGGGNTAMDAARTARRLTGAAVTVVYRRTKREMPATDEEIEGLLAEGNVLEELASPTRIVLQDGRVMALECVRNRLGEPDADGRRRPIPIEGSEFTLAADSIIVAIGQSPDIAFLDGSAVSPRPDGAIAVEPQTGRAAPGVYAGGDAARGPAIIIEACADGRRAAEAIGAQLGILFEPPAARPAVLSETDILGRAQLGFVVRTCSALSGAQAPTTSQIRDLLIPQAKHARARKEALHQPETLPVTQRAGFDLVEQTLSAEAARGEAARCLQCATLCDKCVEVCPNRANYTYFVSPVDLILPRLSCQDGRLVVTGEERFQVQQTRQIVHLADFCNECGNCATFCVHEGKPYRDKPRLFLQERDFAQEDDNAFYMAKSAPGWTIRKREGGKEAWLSAPSHAGELIFANDRLRLVISPSAFQVQTMELKKSFPGEFSLAEPAAMYVLLKGVTTSLPFLPFEQRQMSF